MTSKRSALALALALVSLAATPALAASNHQVVAQQLNGGQGYTVLRVWGTAYEMGYAQGEALADQVVAGVSQIKGLLGSTYYAAARTLIQTTVWKPASIEQELAGLVAGVKAKKPGAALDVLDLKVSNTLGDWAYALACRSHSTWGSFVQAPTRTLSSRRLDLAINFPASMTAVRHHVIVAREPAGGGERWVNLAWPGYVTAITAVNEHGTLAALHNYQSSMAMSGGHMPRCVALRYALTTLIEGLPPSQHLDAVYGALSQQSILTGTFIPYYVPEGHGGVLTCPAGQPCNKKRVPQPAYFGGQVLITTNAETDGQSAPAGGSVWHNYYAAGGNKSLADHYGSLSQGLLSGAPAIHRMAVDYRGQGQMTIWAEGLLSSGSTPVIKLEFADLFSSKPATPPDAGTPPPPADAGKPVLDGGPAALDGGPSADGGAPPPDAGAGADGTPPPNPVADSAAPAPGDRPAAVDAGSAGDAGGGCALGGLRDAPPAAQSLLLLLLFRRRHRQS